MKSTHWPYLGRETFLLLLFAYVILIGGAFTGMVDFRIQLASTVVATAVLGGWLLWRLAKRQRIEVSGIELGWLAFLATQFLAVLFSEDVRRSLPHALLWLAYAIIFYFVLDLLRRGWAAELFEKCLLIVGAIVLAFSLNELVSLFLSWRELSAGLEFAPSFQQRLSGLFGDPNLLAAFANLLMPLALARGLVSRHRGSQVILFGYVLVSWLILYFTDSRGGLLGLGSSLGAFSFLWIFIVSTDAKRRVVHAWNWLRQRRIVFLALLGLVLAGTAFVGWRVLSFQGDTTHAPVADARDIYWDAAWNAVKADPLTGVGPGMYPVQLMQIWSTPPARPYLHAHSFPFQVAAESGLIGVAGLIILVFAIGRRAWDAWRGLEPAGRAHWAGALAALLGLGAHSLVDDFFPFPAVGAVAMLLLAFVVRPAKNGGSEGSFKPAWLLAAGVLAGLFTLFTLNATDSANRAISISAEEPAALRVPFFLDLAASKDPAFAYYWLQSGYSSATSDLGNSIEAYEKGIELEPYYGLNYANLAAVEWTAGQQDEALSNMRIATRLAPESWLFWLNQGVYEEELGQEEAARSSYAKAVQLRPQIRGAAFWQQSELRAAVAAEELPAALPSDDPRVQAAVLVEQGRQAILLSDLVIAEDLLARAWAINDHDVTLYVGFAEVAKAEGNLALAEQYGQMALWIQTASNEPKVEAILLLAEVSLENGDHQLALERFQVAYEASIANTSYGWGSRGWSPYAWFVFQRRAFPEDLVPQLVRADITIKMAQRLLVLADLYDEAGMNDEAQGVRASLIQYLP